VANSVGILSDEQVLDVLKRRRTGRLSCAADGFARVSAVRYDAGDGANLWLQAPDPECLALVRVNPRIRLEVDDVQGPAQWETVLGWGRLEEVEPADRAATRPLYKIRLDALRGYYRTGSRRRHLD
jgi:nitroimidazol reductase NimA-like FMN-containing flavoprotein (pyridoxamine 5'-phosphate oxidase superfamily)